MCAIEHALRGDAGEKPGQLGNLRNIRLPVERYPLRIEPSRQPGGRDLQPRAFDSRGIIAFDQRVIVGHEKKCIDISAPTGLDGGADGAHIVAQMGSAGGGDAGQYASLHGVRL